MTKNVKKQNKRGSHTGTIGSRARLDAVTALERNTRALELHTAALMNLVVRIPVNAKQFVYSVFHEMLPSSTINGGTKLSDIGFDDSPSKDIIRGRINAHRWHGVNLAFGALNTCSVVSDVTRIVAAAEVH